MNKINCEDKSLHLENNCYLLEIDKEKDLEINSYNDNKLVIVGTCNYHLIINVYDNSSLIVNSLNINNSCNIIINLYQNANITYNHSTSCNQDSINNFVINHLKNNSNSLINNNGINLDNGKLLFRIDGIVPKGLQNITCNQNSKIINYQEGNSQIIPNLIIDSNDISANHSSYIGKIDKEIIFYMKSRMMNLKTIKKIIYKSVLLGKMKLTDEEDLFNQIINK